MFTLLELVAQLSFGEAFNRSPAGSGFASYIRLRHGEAESFGLTYCPICGKDRRMKIFVLKGSGTLQSLVHSQVMPDTENKLHTVNPSLVSFQCVQCLTDFHGFIYSGPGGASMAVFGGEDGGVATPKTPDAVKHFLNDAYKCFCIGAHGAAAAMFRAALEQLLTELGYSDGMLYEKTTKLLADQEAGNAPEWAVDLDADSLEIIRRLGNKVVHPKTIEELKRINDSVVIGVIELFQFLLSEIFETQEVEKDFLAKFNLLEDS